MKSFVPSNVARFGFIFAAPPHVIVKEEYVIYDAIAMIGAIGGTMGLCIGFSFMDCIGVFMNVIEKGIDKLKDGRSCAPATICSTIHQCKAFTNSTKKRPRRLGNRTMEIRLEHCESRIETIFNELKCQQDALKSKLETLMNQRCRCH